MMTEVARQAIQRIWKSVRGPARRYEITPKAVAKWRKRTLTADGGEVTVLAAEQEAVILDQVRSRLFRQTLLQLDDCLYVLQASTRNPSSPVTSCANPLAAVPYHLYTVLPDSASTSPSPARAPQRSLIKRAQLGVIAESPRKRTLRPAG